MARIVITVILTLVLSGWTQLAENVPPLANNNNETSDKPTDRSADQRAMREMDVGRYYIGKRDYTASLNRFKIVVVHFSKTRHVEEALAHLTWRSA
jgi:outer membrane lipoprotein YfiO